MLNTTATLTAAFAIGAANPFVPPARVHTPCDENLAPAASQLVSSTLVSPPIVSSQEVNPTPPTHAVLVLDDVAAVTLPGVTRPEHSATLGVPFDGLITELPVQEGVRVRKGDIIAVLDDRVAQQALRVSQTDAAHDASVIRARAVLRRATDALRRAETAYAAGAMNDEQIEEARHRRDIADADLRFAGEVFDKAQAQLELTRAELESHRIRAPFDGVVARVYAEPGEVLSPGELLADIIAPERALVDLYLPAERAIALRRGDRIALALAEPVNAVVPARLRYAEPRVDPTSRATRVVFEIASGRFNIPAGVLVTPATRAPSEADSDRLTALAVMSASETERTAAPNDQRTEPIAAVTE